MNRLFSSYVASALLVLGACSSDNVLKPTTGSLTITVSGLSSPASVTVSGPSGYSQAVSATITLTSLAPGSYTIASAPVVESAATYSAGGAQVVNVVAQTAPATAAVNYQLASGSLEATISGLPAGVTPSVAVTGPSGFSQTLTATITLTNLAPGSYTITPAPVVQSEATYAAGVAQIVYVVAQAAPVTAAVNYQLASGSLEATISGLPSGVTPSVVVTGPSGFSQTLTAAITLTNLAPGNYLLTPAVVASTSTGLPPVTTTYAAAPQNIAVVASLTAANATVAYAAAMGTLTVTVDPTGLPAGLVPSVLITGPFNYTSTITATATIASLPLGTYTVAAQTVSSATLPYSPSSTSANVTLGFGMLTGAAMAGSYYASGSLRVSANCSTPQICSILAARYTAIRWTGPSRSAVQRAPGTRTWSGLVPGVYTISAPSVNGIVPVPAQQTVSVAPSLIPVVATTIVYK